MTNLQSGRPKSPTMSEIVIIEESASDAKQLMRALSKAGIKNPIRWIDDGTKAIDYLEAVTEIPAAVVLDMKLPGLTGLEILDRLRDNPSFEKTLRIVLSSMEVLGPIKEAYARGAHSYLTKPVSPIELANLMKTFNGHWITGASSKRLSAPRRTTSWAIVPTGYSAG
jgi:two-component system response regulator